MKSYKELSYKEIEEMSLEELNEYIKVYGNLLMRRYKRVEQAKKSREKTKALDFILPTIKNISSKKYLSGAPKPDTEILEFKTKREAVARLKNIVENLRAGQSTITGQKQIQRRYRKKTREFIAQYVDKKTAANLSVAKLNFLSDIFDEFGHGREEYTSGEIIDAYIEAIDKKTDIDQMADAIKDILRGMY